MADNPGTTASSEVETGDTEALEAKEANVAEPGERDDTKAQDVSSAATEAGQAAKDADSIRLRKCLVSGKRRRQWLDGWVESSSQGPQAATPMVRFHPSASPIQCNPKGVIMSQPEPYPNATVGDTVMVRTCNPNAWYEAVVVDRNDDIDAFEVSYGPGYHPSSNTFVTADQFYTPIDKTQEYGLSKDQQGQRGRSLGKERLDVKKRVVNGSEKLEILTWNVGCDAKMEGETKRIRGVIDSLRSSQSHILALQGVEDWLLDYLLRQKPFVNRFRYSTLHLAGSKRDLKATGGSVLFSAYPICEVQQHQREGGSVVTLVKVKLNHRAVYVLHVNLPEGDETSACRVRVADARLICSVIATLPSYTSDVFLAGSFGFAPGTRPEADIFSPDYFLDAWDTCNKGKDGFTRDSKGNRFRQVDGREARYEYVLARSSKWWPVSVRLVGAGSRSFAVRATFAQDAPRDTGGEQHEDMLTGTGHEDGEDGLGTNVSTLKVLTYNVDAREEVKTRLTLRNGLFDVIQDSNADIVCLQEARPWFVDMFGKLAWVKDAYPYSTISFFSGGSSSGSSPLGIAQRKDPFLPWFLVIYSRYPIADASVFYRKPHLNTRCCLAATVLVQPSVPVRVGNVYLNASLSGGCERAMNLGFSLRAVRARPATGFVVAGGFNFKPGFTPESQVFDGADAPAGVWTDAWDETRNGEEEKGDGATWDPTTNTMIYGCPEVHLKAIRNIWGPSRLDRVLYRSDDVWEAKGATVLGTKPVGGLEGEDSFSNDSGSGDESGRAASAGTYPSSHFGVLVEFEKA